MRDLTLFYRGPLYSSGQSNADSPTKTRHKHDLRKVFETQIKSRFAGQMSMVPKFNLIHVGAQLDHMFLCPATFANRTVANISITLLRPEPPGNIVVEGGDIDNRLKTIFDALRVPKLHEIPSGETDAIARMRPPFHCLLEDDKLITSVSVKTAQLLDISPDDKERQHEVVLLVNARLEVIDPVEWIH